MQQQQQRKAALIASAGAAWAGQIAATTLKLVATLLAAGGATAAAIASLLGDLARAADIALTEATRASSAGASSAYADAGVLYVRWVTEPGACEECEANEAAGRWPLGVPFPSGAIEPPQHPRCRCATVPA